MNERCDYLPSRSDYAFAGQMAEYCSDGAARCVLAEGHRGPHLIHRDIRGDYWEWEYDSSVCECADADLEEEMCQCFIFWEADPADARERIRNEGPS